MRRAVVPLALATALAAGAAVVASATPSAGTAGPILSRGHVEEPIVIGVPTTTTVKRRVRIRAGGRTHTRRVRVKVPSVTPLISCSKTKRCDSAFQQVTISPGGHTGWHTHPGPTFVAVTQGEGTLYHGSAAGGSCMSHKYTAGQGFFQPETDQHTLRNEGTTNLVVHAFYLFPAGTPNTAARTDQPQPASCPTVP